MKSYKLSRCKIMSLNTVYAARRAHEIELWSDPENGRDKMRIKVEAILNENHEDIALLQRCQDADDDVDVHVFENDNGAISLRFTRVDVPVL